LEERDELELLGFLVFDFVTPLVVRALLLNLVDVK
jgi:hypothetical protein